MAVAASQSPVGEMLCSWRRRRSLSQLQLSLNAGVSSRHLSFLETGRARPSREMVLRLAEELQVPPRERNTLLLAAGFAPLYTERSLEEPEMELVRDAIDRFLRAHEPYPALVIDRYHDLLASNDALGTLLEGVSPELLAPPANSLRIALHPEGMASRTVNFGEWSAHLMQRLHREMLLTADPRLERLHDELAGYPGVELSSPQGQLQAQDIVLPVRLRDGDRELVFFSTLSTFGTAVDITLAELSIEAFYPANAHTANRLLSDVGADPAAGA
ncbi:MAG TPA: helix-turn-helix transcriptional regulator [Solirubrobacteraceae bacterium]|jgi:transcriptional regulator with XRE-family HTH domain|nr:helix-turn-helix transcriptional regulator [Solirubrobacteraceae bacterium]